MTAYQWKRGAYVRGDAQICGEVCEQLERRGCLTPPGLVDASRPADAPLHGMFEWNDAQAAELYREQQARTIINSIEVKLEGVSEPVKAFVSLRIGGTERRYERTEIALANPKSREMVLKDALAELKAFERKYSTLAELSGVIAAIRAVA